MSSKKIMHLEVGLPSRLLDCFKCTPFQRVLVFEPALFCLGIVFGPGSQPWVSADLVGHGKE